MEFLQLDALLTAQGLIGLVTLAALEIVLGIDNIVFIAILAEKLPENQQSRARRLGLLAAMVTRILLLLAIGWIMGLTAPLFTVLGVKISGKSLILIGGGLFLLAKATREIHHRVDAPDDGAGPTARQSASFASAIIQIMIMDIVFSIDSVITAVGMAESPAVMIVAVVIAVVVMMIFADPVSAFIKKHATLKMLALAFLLLIGLMLVVEGIGQHVNKGYIYFAMGFSLAVELLNLRAAKVSRLRASKR